MRLPVLALAMLLPAAPSLAAQSGTPRQMMEELGVAPSLQDVARAVERARNEPLGSSRNPVRVSGAQGEHAYIARLRCGDGSRPQVGDRHNAGVGAFGSIVDVWPLDCGSAAPGRFDLVLDMYHDNYEETRAPAGFSLTPAGDGRGEGGSTGKPASQDPTV
jgi:hypothetical protein